MTGRALSRTDDKLFWMEVRIIRRDWRRQLVLVTPRPVVRWQRPGFGLKPIRQAA